MSANRKAVLKLFAARHGRPSNTDLAKVKADKHVLKELADEEIIIRHRGRWYLVDAAPTRENEQHRIELMLLAKPRLFREATLKLPANVHDQRSFAGAIRDLIDAGKVRRFELEKGASLNARYLYIHADHLIEPGTVERASDVAIAAGASGAVGSYEDAGALAHHEPETPVAIDEVNRRIREAYRLLSRRLDRPSVFISDLAQESELPVSVVQDWLHRQVVERGYGTLDEGDWASASPAAKAAAMELRGRPRLLTQLF